MIQAIVFILKIIGILLAVLLALVMLSVCVVLFVPVCHRLTGESEGKLEQSEFCFRFSWLLHLISGYVTYQEQSLDWQVRLAWIKLNAKETLEETSEEVVHSGEEKIEEYQSQEMAKELEEEASEACPKENEETDKQTEDTKGQEYQNTHRMHVRKKKVRAKKSLWKRIQYTYEKICDKIKILRAKKEYVEKFISKPVHKKAWKRLKKESIRLLKAIRPRKLEANVRFGFEDPSLTGRTLAVLGILYPYYGECVQIVPDFENAVLEGTLFMKGRIYLVSLLRMGLKLFFDKSVRITYKDAKRLKVRLLGGKDYGTK